jgi:cytochrome c oxidase subunit 2
MEPQQAAKHVIDQGTFWLPRQGSTLAPEIDFGWDVAMWVSIFFFIIVMVPLGLFVWKYRRKHVHEVGGPTGHNTAIEIGWSVVPLAIVMGCFLVGFRGWVAASVPPAESYEIQVTASKWKWVFTYPNGKQSTNELNVPVGRPVKMIMSSQDVLHSFYIPEFRVKQDVIPGSYSSVWFEATEVGENIVECAEYCGGAKQAGHSEMLASVHVLPEDKFQEWLNADKYKGMEPVAIGAMLYKEKTCNTCHSLDGTRITGPSFKGVFGRTEQFADGSSGTVDENYIRESVLNPTAKVVLGYPPVMPSFKGQFKDEEFNALIAYLKTVK